MGTIKRSYSNNILSDGKFDATDLTGTIPSGNIDGVTIQQVAGDPPAPVEGQIWYNTSTDKFRGRLNLVTAAAWASGGTRGTTNLASYGNIGNRDAALAMGGSNPSPGFVNTSESYNGTSWTATPSLNTTRRETEGAFGTTSAGVCAGGYQPPGSPSSATEEWNGSSWTSVNSMGQARYSPGALGTTQTAGLLFGGGHPVSTFITNTEEYDGTNWTAGGATPEGDRNTAGFGTQTAGVKTGGQPSGGNGTAATHEYNGTAWTTVNNSNIARKSHGAAGDTQSDGINMGGDFPSLTNSAESYDGTSWSSAPNMNITIGGGFTGAGSGSNAIAVGAPQSIAQEFTGSFTGLSNGEINFTADE